jgi:diaminohydroxyphosphoribosylaminopyrimidine deaminase/5-amino-6-(5-phosphoribosylamino)uracil reductase
VAAGDERPGDAALMARATEVAEHSRLLAPPNPWVGAVVVAGADSPYAGVVYAGSTRRPGGNHAEIEALAAAGEQAAGSTLYVTLEPCSFAGRTGPCVDAVRAAGVRRVVIGVLDPDERVAGRGVAKLEAAGIEVTVGPGEDLVEAQLAPYLTQRRTGRPFVVVKIAATLDGRTAAADGTSQWITGAEARLDVHRLRAESDAILVGAGTVRDDDPRLTVRGIEAPDGAPPREPLRVVLGRASPESAIHPCLELSGDPGGVLDELGRRDVVQLLVEGGANVAGQFHRAGLVDRYVVYLAPALMGGDDGAPMLTGPGAATIGDLHRLQLDRTVKLGNDLRVDLTTPSAAGLA